MQGKGRSPQSQALYLSLEPLFWRCVVLEGGVDMNYILKLAALNFNNIPRPPSSSPSAISLPRIEYTITSIQKSEALFVYYGLLH